METKALLEKIIASQVEAVAAIEAEAQAAVSVIETDAHAVAEKAAAQISRATLAQARQSGSLAVQTARRAAFDDIMAAAKKTVAGDDVETARAFDDKRAQLELHLAGQLPA